jgi:hypothetical protein
LTGNAIAGSYGSHENGARHKSVYAVPLSGRRCSTARFHVQSSHLGRWGVGVVMGFLRPALLRAYPPGTTACSDRGIGFRLCSSLGALKQIRRKSIGWVGGIGCDEARSDNYASRSGGIWMAFACAAGWHLAPTQHDAESQALPVGTRLSGKECRLFRSS